MGQNIQTWGDFIPWYQCEKGFTPNDYTCAGAEYFTYTAAPLPNDMPAYIMFDPLHSITVAALSFAVLSTYMAYDSYITKGNSIGHLWLLPATLFGGFGLDLLQKIITG